jgi:cellulose synthase operon protein C
LSACQSAVHSVKPTELEEFVTRLMESKSAEVRRVAVAALARDGGSDRGWTDERLARLTHLQNDTSPLVSGAACAVFPPREMMTKKPS